MDQIVCANPHNFSQLIASVKYQYVYERIIYNSIPYLERKGTFLFLMF